MQSIGSAAPLPPRPSLLAQAGPTLLGVLGGIAGAVLGGIVPGAGTALGAFVGTTLGSTAGSSVGTLFRGGDQARITADWQRELTDHARTRQAEVSESEGLRGQVTVAGFGNYGSRPGDLGIPIPGLQGEALQEFLR